MKRLLGACGRLFVSLFGRIAWQPPGWLQAHRSGLAQSPLFAPQRRRIARLLGLGLLLVGLGVLATRWWMARPRPHETTVKVISPGATNLAEKRPPEPVVLLFSSPVAPLRAIGKPVTAGIAISPAIEGAWTWQNDRRLTFQPKHDWPVGKSYAVRLEPRQLLTPAARLATSHVSFVTAPFSIRIAGHEFHQDPVSPELKQVVVSFEFSHPVDAKSFESRLRMRLITDDTKPGAADLKVHVSYDRLKLRGHVHSDPIAVPERDAHVELAMTEGARTTAGGAEFGQRLEARVEVPGRYSLLKIGSMRMTIVENARNEPEKVLVIETSAGVREAEMQKAVQAWILPRYDPEAPEEASERRPHAWTKPELVGVGLLAKSTPVTLEPIASEQEYATRHAFKLRGEPGRWLYVRVNRGLRAFGGYLLDQTADATQRLPSNPAQLRILHSGSILSSSGERKVGLLVRDVPAIRIEVGRVLPGQLHHLFTQAHGEFQHPDFGESFTDENLAEVATDVRDLRAAMKPGKPLYEALDLDKYVAQQGVFLLRVTSLDLERNVALNPHDDRLIVVSDLGLVVKESSDHSYDLFVQSLHGGEPVAGALIQALGKNGRPIASVSSSADGHARVGTLAWAVREQAPAGWVVTKGHDTSFLPFARSDRLLELSRFDVGGIAEPEKAKSLSAYVFSDRGLYRPGEEMHIGVVVRSRDWQAALAGLPLAVEVTDARGLSIKKETLQLGATGFEALSVQTPKTAPTGTYTINVHTVKDGRHASLIGSTTVRVREFLPDRMKIAVTLSATNPRGWVSPDGLVGRVRLTNLYGTPAARRSVRAELRLRPIVPAFPQWPDYEFSDLAVKKESLVDPLAERMTDEAGDAELALDLRRFTAAVYRLSLFAEGFEADSGRGVAAEVTALVSPRPYLIGYKTSGNLAFLAKGSAQGVALIAVGPTGDRVDAAGLKAVLYERKYLSVLTRQDNGTYKYESVKREQEASHRALTIEKKGATVALDTARPGDFVLVVTDANEEPLARIEYSVAGAANLARAMDRSAELELRLATSDVRRGDTLELAIKAPFAGAGLITIERDRVYSYHWFRSDTEASVQHIPLPPAFEGSGYVSVALLRATSAADIFTSPLSYGVVPFSVSRQQREAHLEVVGRELVRPGEPYKMTVKSDRPLRAVVFAVDEGILRVARHATPDPLEFFFRKRALTVETAQTLDLMLPEYGRLRAALAPGGDNDSALAEHLNPFQRPLRPAVAYWSGLQDIGPGGRELVYAVPGDFNGTLRIMAIGVDPATVAKFEKAIIVRSDFVITPTLPVVAAPGDEFELSATVANNLAGTRKRVPITVALTTSPGLEVLGSKEGQLEVAAQREGLVQFRLRAGQKLGAQTVTLTASGAGKTVSLRSDLSVRPATPYLVTFQAGHLKEGTKTVTPPRQLYAEERSLQAGISRLPLGLTHGLTGYLEKFPHGCTEQLVSQMIPAIALARRPELGFTPAGAAKIVERAIALLATRQNEEGGFGLWASNVKTASLPSVWALHALIEAREHDFTVPAEILRAGLRWLEELTSTPGDSLEEERVRAYAIYVLTRSGVVTTPRALALQRRLERDHRDRWRRDLAAAYLAATYQLLRQASSARELMAPLVLATPVEPDFRYYYDGLARDAQLLYLWARHFPARAAAVTPEALDAMAQPIFRGSYNTFSSASTILALAAYAESASVPDAGLQAIRELGAGKRTLDLPSGALPLVDYSPAAKGLELESRGAFGSYWVVSQRGFDLELPRRELAEKVEVFREYTDARGQVVDKVKQGEELQVHLRVRAQKGTIADLAVVDLLPGGFEVVLQGPRQADEGEGETETEPGGGAASDEGEDEPYEPDGPPEPQSSGLAVALPSSTFLPEFSDVREDRLIFYGAAEATAHELVYVIRATNVGRFTVPPVQAEGLYDRSVLARSRGGSIEVLPR